MGFRKPDEFDIEKRNGQWLVVKFAPGTNWRTAVKSIPSSFAGSR
jgi:hypothetical protein